MFLRQAEPKIKITATINHCSEHLIDGVAVNARAFRDLATKFAAVAAQEAARGGRGVMAGGGGGKMQAKGGGIGGALEKKKAPPLLLVISPRRLCFQR